MPQARTRAAAPLPAGLPQRIRLPGVSLDVLPRLPLICGLLCLLALATGAQARSPIAGSERVEVVVLLRAPSLAEASGSRAPAAARVAAEQRRFVRALRAAVP